MHLPSLGLPPRCWTSSSQVLRQRFPHFLFTLVHHSTYILTPTSLLHQLSLRPTNKRLGGITSQAAVVRLRCQSPLPHCIPPFSSVLFVRFSHFLVRTEQTAFRATIPCIFSSSPSITLSLLLSVVRYSRRDCRFAGARSLSSLPQPPSVFDIRALYPSTVAPRPR